MKTSLLIIMALIATALHAGPFGIDMGMSMAQITESATETPIEIAPGMWEIKPKKTHPDIETYVVIYAPKFGATGVRAVSKDITSGTHGIQLRTRVESITDQLSGVYGRPTKEFDFLPRGSLWDGDHEYMMSLRQDERNYIKFWDQIDKDDVVSIMLKVSATSRTVGYFVIDYMFANSDAAAEAQKAQNAQSL